MNKINLRLSIQTLDCILSLVSHTSTNNINTSPISPPTSLLIKDMNMHCSINDVFTTFIQLLKSSLKMNLHATIIKIFIFLINNHSSSFDTMNSIINNSHFTLEYFEYFE